jgi:hypothetical protein
VRAAREEGRKHHQVRQREQPLLRLCAGCLRRPCDHTQVAAPSKIMHVLHTDTRQTGDFRVGKDLLARLYGYQVNLTYLRRIPLPTSSMFRGA